MDTQPGGWARLSLQEDPERGKVAGLANILHISVLVGAVKYPHSWNWRSESPQRVVWWVGGECSRPYVQKMTHIAALTLAEAETEGWEPAQISFAHNDTWSGSRKRTRTAAPEVRVTEGKDGGRMEGRWRENGGKMEGNGPQNVSTRVALICEAQFWRSCYGRSNWKAGVTRMG